MRFLSPDAKRGAFVSGGPISFSRSRCSVDTNDGNGIDRCATGTVGCSKPRNLDAIMARLKGGRCQRLGPAPRRRNPGCMLMRQLMIDSCQIQAAAGGGLGDTSLFAEDAGAEDNCVTLRCMPRAAKQTTEASLFSCGGLADRPPPAFGRHCLWVRTSCVSTIVVARAPFCRPYISPFLRFPK